MMTFRFFVQTSRPPFDGQDVNDDMLPAGEAGKPSSLLQCHNADTTGVHTRMRLREACRTSSTEHAAGAEERSPPSIGQAHPPLRIYGNVGAYRPTSQSSNTRNHDGCLRSLCIERHGIGPDGIMETPQSPLIITRLGQTGSAFPETLPSVADVNSAQRPLRTRHAF